MARPGAGDLSVVSTSTRPREDPVPGVTSALIIDAAKAAGATVTAVHDKSTVRPERRRGNGGPRDLVLTMGAGRRGRTSARPSWPACQLIRPRRPHVVRRREAGRAVARGADARRVPGAAPGRHGAAFVGEYTDTKTEGVYSCRACGAELFTSGEKFESHCGWPSFFDPKDTDASNSSRTATTAWSAPRSAAPAAAPTWPRLRGRGLSDPDGPAGTASNSISLRLVEK